MEGEWSCYGGSNFEGVGSCYRDGSFNGGSIVMLQRWPVEGRKNGHYESGQFNGEKMVMLQRGSL